jgi:predicted phage terminase large subunit-like protein
VQASDLRTYEELPELHGWAITVDAAFKKTTAGSRVSVQVWGRRGPDRFLVDNDTRPMNMVETMASIEAMREKWPRAKACVLVEDKANGSEIIRQLREKFPGVVAINPGNNSKEGRLYACQSYFTGHNVYLPKYAPWLEDFKAELTQFPNWPKDDQVDAAVQVLLYWRLSNDAARARAACTL